MSIYLRLLPPTDKSTSPFMEFQINFELFVILINAKGLLKTVFQYVSWSK